MNKSHNIDISGCGYITDFVCTYHLFPNNDDSLLLYQIQLLQAFNLDIFNDNKINEITKDLYEKYKNNKYIIGIINSNIIDINIEADDLTKFRMYFGYDTFNILHNILCSLINNTNVNDNNYKLLFEKKVETKNKK